MSSRLVMTRKDPRHTDFVLAGDPAAMPIFSSDTARYTRPRNGSRATTTITRTDSTGERFQVGVIEWPVHPHDAAQLVVGTRDVHMFKVGVYTSGSERFVAADGIAYEWQILDARPQLVPLRAPNQPPSSHVAFFVQSQSGRCFWRKHTSSLLVPPEGHHILDDIVVTFVYFLSKWRDKESARSRSSVFSPVM